ncbi:MAG: YceD family protein [Gammaproteobacteria bacterium]
MIEHLPDRLDLQATAEAGRVMRGRIPLAKLERALPALASSDGELQVVLELGKDPAGIRYLAGTIQGEVMLQCQRCLEPVEQALDLKFRLGLVQNEAAIAGLPEHYEALLLTGEPASVADIISDEVLLALPLVPLHQRDARCEGIMKDYQPSANETRESPFAVLAKLKQKQP